MKRLAIFVGGLLVLPAFAEVAPVFITDEGAVEYADAMYDENGFLIIPETEMVEETTETAASETPVPVKISRAPVNATPIANRTTATRATPTATKATASGRGTAAGNSSRVVAARTTTSARTDASRAVASRGTTTASPRSTGTATATRTATTTAATRAAAARTTGGSSRATTTAGGTTVARTATTAGRTTAARTATTAAGTARATTTGAGRLSVDPNRNVGTAAKSATITASNGTVTLTDSGSSLYNENRMASVRRTPTIRMSSVSGVSADTTSVSMSLEDMDDLAELTDYCKAQYASCMDNYCNVLDDNQGRCSCSANLKNYAKAEAALKTATEELQDVAQKIQYIGLTAREVETLFTETAAEEKMRTNGTDNSQLQANLNKIKDMIINVSSGGATSTADNGILNFDLSGLLEFSFDSTGFDLASLFGTTNTNSVSNQRGEQLYKTAAARCKTSVLKACTARGVDASLITNAYDLEIDRECMAYERSLNDSNDQMLATVRNAKNVLQKARLMVAQQKNAYDMRGCINALDECMQDEFVCGSDYENCLDPTGRYIVNGEIVVGSQPGHAIDPEARDLVSSVMTSDVCRVNLYRTWDMPGATCQIHADPQGSSNYTTYLNNPTYNQNNAWGSGTGDTLSEYITQTVKSNSAEKVSENMSKYLQNKIGYVNKDGRAYGMCVSVLNKCQDYSYDGKGTSAKYKQDNDVIKQYLARVLIQIKAKQDEILANYAESCVSDVTTCLTQNGYPTEDPIDWDADERSTNTTKMNIAVNACRAQIVTCMSVNGYSIDTPTPTEMNCWVQGLLYSTSTDECMWDNKVCDDGYDWCSSTGTCMLTGTCPSTPTSYTVTINCNGGTLNTTSPKTTTGSLQLSSTWCSAQGNENLVGWVCGPNNQNLGVNGKYEPSVTQSSCTAQWSSGPTQYYTVQLSCSDNCTGDGYYRTVAQGYEITPSQWCAGPGQTATWDGACSRVGNGSFPVTQDITCNATCSNSGGGESHSYTLQCGTNCNTGLISGSATTDTTVSFNQTCGDIKSWSCSGLTPTLAPNDTYFTMPNNDVFCTAECNGGGQSETYTIHIYCGLNNFVPGQNATPKCPSGDCGDVVVGSDDFPIDLTQYCSLSAERQEWTCPEGGGTLTPNWQFTPAQQDATCVLSDKGSSTGNGGLRYVEINDQGGTRTPRTRALAPDNMNAFWVDTNGSECSNIGVYISDPTEQKVVCEQPVTDIGWFKLPGSRSSGYYIYVDGELFYDNNGVPVLFAREDGRIIEENLSKLADTDPDATITARAKVYGNEVVYVSFDENNHMWDPINTVLNDEDYFIYDNFDINFYPNRPTTANSNTPMTLRYAQGTGYIANGTKQTIVPTVSETNYTFRGYYPGIIPAVSENSSTGKVWPSTRTTLANKSWVLATTDANFNGLNLYAAWAEKCNNVDNGTCTLDINSSGAVDYGITCITGYEPRGTGADVKCVAPGENWNSITLPGAE